jgi:hypothetical protein
MREEHSDPPNLVRRFIEEAQALLEQQVRP